MVEPVKVLIEWTCDNDDEHEGADDQEIVHQTLADSVQRGRRGSLPPVRRGHGTRERGDRLTSCR